MLLQRYHNNVDYTGYRAKREYPDRGVNWGSTINKGYMLNGLVRDSPHSRLEYIYNNWRRMMENRTND